MSQLPDEDYLRSFLEGPDYVGMVARTEIRVVGGLVAYILPKFEQDRRKLYVYDLAVATEHHGRGIGRQLLDAIRREATALDAYVVWLQADADDAAVGFYRRLSPVEGAPARNFDFDPLD